MKGIVAVLQEDEEDDANNSLTFTERAREGRPSTSRSEINTPRDKTITILYAQRDDTAKGLTPQRKTSLEPIDVALELRGADSLTCQSSSPRARKTLCYPTRDKEANENISKDGKPDCHQMANLRPPCAALPNTNSTGAAASAAGRAASFD
ncbi:hypothetical protein EYF80_003332 [Liparis tanakae]|uniref:Uncharacterized protein n=1 Tax=Liparis tanakae TaxID=230148 RepID=A0A4Z2JB09_9TELE|nr:hypothetical protein EYF80_003332 [Liparis tanakae]